MAELNTFCLWSEIAVISSKIVKIVFAYQSLAVLLPNFL